MCIAENIGLESLEYKGEIYHVQNNSNRIQKAGVGKVIGIAIEAVKITTAYYRTQCPEV